jgi:hypothetical protein
METHPVLPSGHITDLEEFEAATELALKGLALVVFTDGRWASATMMFTDGESGAPDLTQVADDLPDLLRALGIGHHDA